VNVADLLRPLRLRMNVEIVVTRQPKWTLFGLLGDGGLQCLDRAIQQPAPWL
jgi:hypothetical protein